MPANTVQTNFKDDYGTDLGTKLVTKDYLISVYPGIAESLGISPELWVWGSGSTNGNLGNFVSDFGLYVSTPITTFAGGSNWKQVESNTSPYAIKTDGTLWSWGSFISSVSLGGSSGSVRLTPSTIFSGGTDWKQICSTDSSFGSSAAIKTDGTLWTWGTNFNSELGTNTAIGSVTPVTTVIGGNNWKQVSMAVGNIAAIKTDGTLWTWGEDNAYGSLGRPLPEYGISTPITTFAGGTNWADTATTNPEDLYTLSISDNHTAAVKTDGTLWIWGNGAFYGLGIGNNVQYVYTPVTTFAGGTNWKQVSAGSRHTVAVKTDGTLWSWGNNDKGQLGVIDILNISTPITTFAGGNNWADTPTTNPEDLYTLSAGNQHTAAVKTDGTLWTWGRNYGGGLGDNSITNRLTPVTTFSGGTNWKQVSSGRLYTSAIKTDGTLWVWGSGSYGRLGNGITTGNISTPITTFVGGTDWKQVSSGYQHTAAIKTDGTLWTWGNGTNGELGRPRFETIRSTPVTTFAGGNNWADTATTNPEDLYTLSAGSLQSAAIKTDGTLWVWGKNTSGQLGLNILDITGGDRLTPVTTFAGGTNWRQVTSKVYSGFGESSFAIKTDGTLWTWGSGYRGRLGNGVATGTISTPVTTFAGGTNWKQVSCKFNHVAAIKTDGTLWTWGRGSYGRLANADVNDAFTPITTFAGGTNWKQVSTGQYHAAAIKTDGTLWMWGRANNGCLGNGVITGSILTPVTTFAGGTDWKQVEGGDQHTIAIKTDGTLWTWGSGGSARLGNAVITGNISTPVTTFAGGTNWKQVSGSFHTAAIKTDGTLWTWGSGQTGRLGNAVISGNISTPITTFAGGTNWKQVSAGEQHTVALQDDGVNKQLYAFGTAILLGSFNQDDSVPKTTFSGGTNWKQVSAGRLYTSAIKTDGTLWTWGNGTTGRLGNAVTTNVSTPVTTFTGGIDWKQVSSGYQHTAAIKTDGTLWTWGNGNNGRLGNAVITGNRSTPVTTFAGGTNWKQVSANGYSSTSSHTAAVKTDGTLWTWGNGGNGKLGNGITTGNISTPVTTFTGGTNWKQVSAGDTHTVALQDDGVNKQLYAFGNASLLGKPSFQQNIPNPVDISSNWKQVSAGQQHTAAVKTDGTLWTWGYNNTAQLGILFLTGFRSTPVTTFAGGTNWKQVSAGNLHTAAIKTDGTLWVWGNGNNGRLGNGTVTGSRPTPLTTFAGGTDWKQVSAGSNHTSAVKTDGTLWTWGYGGSGRLGNANTTSVSTPVTTFAGGTNWKQVSGSFHTAAIKTDGTLWTWGSGQTGRLGNAVISGNISTPITTFAGGTNWKQVSAGEQHTVALQDDGVNKQLYAFGSNLFLTGNDNQVYKFSKIPSTTFAGGTNWKQVSTGYRHTSAIKTDGTLWTWGSGYSGQLGNIQITSRSTPVTTFAGGTNWKQVTIGYSSTGAIKTDGTLWMWGQYQFGKLGFYDINFTETRTTPITTFAGGNNWADTATTNPEDLYTIFAGSTYGADEHVVTAIKTDGTLWTWGYEGFYGSLGINNYNSNIRTLTPVTTFAGGTNWKQLGTSGFSSAAIKTDGTLWTWGSNYNGSLGTNNVVQNDTEQRKTPVTTFAGGTNWKQVTIGYSSTGAIKTDGTLWMWGYNINGQLGINNETETLTPVTTFAGGTDWKQVSCGGYMTGAIKTDGTLWMWGANFYGDAGINDFGRPITPVTTFAGGTNWKQVSCSAAGHVGAVKTDGTLWLWGKANLGMLGNAVDTGEIYTPVTTFAGGTDWKQVSCGGIHSSSIGSTAAIKTDGTLWTWGYNYQGSLGTNDTTDSSTPVTTFIGGTNWRQVNNSCSVTVALKGDGISNEIYVFGNSNYLGINYISSVITPVTTFAGGTNWKQVSAGSNHTAAIKTDGTLWVWGIGYSGVLGNAVTTNVFTPITTFAGGTDWKQVSASANNTMAIKSIDY